MSRHHDHQETFFDDGYLNSMVQSEPGEQHREPSSPRSRLPKMSHTSKWVNSEHGLPGVDVGLRHARCQRFELLCKLQEFLESRLARSVPVNERRHWG